MYHSRQRGVTYLAVIFLVGAMGMVLAALGVVWSTSSQREKEKELLMVGTQFRDAIGMYYEKSPGTLKKYPDTLDDLLKDNRQLGMQRYLRKIFTDPITRTNKWGLVLAPMGGVMGVYSLSKDVPLKAGNFADVNVEFSGMKRYDEWKFIYLPVQQNFQPR